MTSRLIVADDLKSGGLFTANDEWALNRGLLGNTIQNIKVVAALAAGDFVNIFDNGGVPGVRPAIANDTTHFANGFVVSAFAVNATASVFLIGLNTAVSVPTTIGEVYLSDTTAGKALGVSPSTTGHIRQPLGVAIQNAGIFFTPRTWTLIP